MYHSNHGKEYVICGMEKLAFDIIICWKWFGMKKQTNILTLMEPSSEISATRNEIVKVVSKVKGTQLFCHQLATNLRLFIITFCIYWNFCVLSTSLLT